MRPLVFKISGSIAAILLVAVISLTPGCKPEEVTEPTLPSNLVVDVVIDEDDLGVVSVMATADKANFFTIMFEEDGDETLEESSEATYTYSTAGTHDIRVRAHATTSDFIEKVEMVTIEFPDPGSGGNSGKPSTGYESPLTRAGYNLAWNDEFDGTSLNLSDWNYEIGTGSGGWGNNELQYYLEDNTTVDDGVLIITAKNETFNQNNYTSSRITTQGKQSFQYGRIDIRAALPKGQGLWPALWMLGNTFSSSGWPACGEIDIMELVGGGAGRDDVVYGTVHWDDNGHAEYGDNNQLSSGTYADEFHVFSIVWDDQAIRWYRDDILYNTIDITPSALSEFHQEFFFIFNVAVGGNWPGSPDGTTVFPQTMYVDYVRVFQK